MAPAEGRRAGAGCTTVFRPPQVAVTPSVLLPSSFRCGLTRSKWRQQRKGALERIAAACPQLAELDCAGARNLTGEHLEAAAARGGLSRLTRLALGRCDAVQRAGPLLATLGRLVALDLSHTGVQVCEPHALIPESIARPARHARTACAPVWGGADLGPRRRAGRARALARLPGPAIVGFLFGSQAWGAGQATSARRCAGLVRMAMLASLVAAAA